MKKEDIRPQLLKRCRYYHGEAQSPYKDDNKAMFWDIERVWLEKSLEAFNRNEDSIDVLGDMLDEYISAGLRQFEEQDDTPATLKALLFNRYCYWNSGSMLECVPGFKKFYKEEYI